jgi:hypothetical protein
MCEHLNTTNDNCDLKTTFPDGSRFDPKIASIINNTFKELATNRDITKKSPLGYGCGGPKCCYIYNEFVKTKDCPYFTN